jgi:hypothetical protein
MIQKKFRLVSQQKQQKNGNKAVSTRAPIMELPGKTELFWSEKESERNYVAEKLLPTRWWVEAPMDWFDDWTSEKGGPNSVGDESPIIFPRPPESYRPPLV